MAFNASDFNLVENGFTAPLSSNWIWTYTTTDTVANTAVAGSTPYFQDAALMKVRTGDFIFVTASDGYAIYLVTGGSPTTPYNPPGELGPSIGVTQFAVFSGTTSVWP